jgi:hypothetical protein
MDLCAVIGATGLNVFKVLRTGDDKKIKLLFCPTMHTLMMSQ